MIAVVANKNDHPAVAEFFQLFKTPWCFHEDGMRCDVLLCASGDLPETSAKLVLIFGGDEHRFDQENGIESENRRGSAVLKWNRDRIPVYRNCRIFKNSDAGLLVDERTHECVSLEFSSGEQSVVRIGIDLFEEVRFLLSRGQPTEFAYIPTLDLHIAFLRDLLDRHAIPFAEIPPVPLGYNFTACLTHDVDHPRVRDHFGDHTMFGFLYRATIGSFVDWGRGRKTLAQVAMNLRAAVALPFVYLGIARDFWDQFDRYRQIEGGVKSTFFVIPKKGETGTDADGRKREKRAARYDLESIASDLYRLDSAGWEVGAHGIDAWRDSASGRSELERVQSIITGSSEIGVRMHWLFFSEQSPAVLEEAGYGYDSTIGYNNTVGYRAGTGQIFKPLEVHRLLELPLHAMDTAMFYPSYMNLSFDEARQEMTALIDNAERFGGVLTVNWHDRSLAPERQWDQPYIELLAELKRRGAWMPTANDAVAWARQRRAISIVPNESNEWLQVSLPQRENGLPGFRIRSHSGASRHGPRSKANRFVEYPVTHSEQFPLNAAEQHFNAA